MAATYQRRWESRRERRAKSVADQSRDSYYGVPVIHAPHWKWLIIWYFFLGGIAGASYVIASLARLVGGDEGRRAARVGRYISVAAILPSPILLILDLGRPERFYNMLRVFKFRSPMSVGSWGLFVFGGFSTLSAAIQLAEDGLLGRRNRLARLLRALPGPLIGLVGCGPAFFVSGYTGVLLAATAVPLWAKNYRIMGPLFVSSALSSAGAAITLVLALLHGERAAIEPVERVDQIARGAEMALLAASHRNLGPVIGAPLTSGTTGRVYKAGVLGSAFVAQLLLVLGRRSRSATLAASALNLLAGFLFRYVWVMAGHASAEDPKATFAFTSAKGRSGE